LNAREIFLRVLDFAPADRTLDWEFGYWGGTLRRWYAEGLEERSGLPPGTVYGDVIAGPGLQWPETSYDERLHLDEDVARQFGFDKGFTYLHVNQWLCPRFEERVLAETEDTVTVFGGDGITRRMFRDQRSMPLFLDWPVKDARDWDRLVEERLNLNNPAQRLLRGFAEDARAARTRDYPLSLLGDPCGFFGCLRYLFGEVALFYAYYDAPALIHRITGYLCDFWISFMEELYRHVDFDFGYFFEDMAGKQGMLVSPAIFQEFMAPPYRRIIDFMKARGLRHFIVDSDGFVEDLIPLLQSVGVTGMLPFERQAGNDLRRIRRRHPRLQMMGGFNKSVLRDGNANRDADVAAELAAIAELVPLGGYIPFADHFIPPDVSLESFTRYRRGLQRVIRTSGITPM
jgi:Uroporphyrinogen decarboxylase (URO-D)